MKYLHIFQMLAFVSFFSGLSAQIPVKGLIGYFPFSGDANDYSGFGNHGSVNGANLTTDRFRHADSAYQFNGNEYILLSSSYDSFPRTVSIWFNATQIDANYRVIFSVDNKELTKGSYGFAVQKLNNQNKLIYWSCGIQDTVAVLPNAWNHVIIVADTAYTGFYLNSKPVGNSTNINFYHSLDVSTHATIGTSRSLIHRFFIGLIDDLRIYNRKLTEGELNALFNEGKSTHLVHALTENKFLIYPNPAKDFITLQNIHGHAMVGNNIKIMNSLSQTLYDAVLNEENTLIDLSAAGAKGVLWVMIRDASGTLLQVLKFYRE